MFLTCAYCCDILNILSTQEHNNEVGIMLSSDVHMYAYTFYTKAYTNIHKHTHTHMSKHTHTELGKLLYESNILHITSYFYKFTVTYYSIKKVTSLYYYLFNTFKSNNIM